MIIDNFKKADNINIKLMRDNGVEVTYMPLEERAKWVEKANFIWDNWAKEMDQKGLPGTRTVKTYFELLEKYEK